jgi:hypothetical protein
MIVLNFLGAWPAVKRGPCVRMVLARCMGLAY